jgi:autotransporter adhesin
VSSLSTGLSTTNSSVSSLSTSTSTGLVSLSTLISSGQSHYVSVNDGGTQQGNYTNNGATGTNAVAIGANASASSDGGVALGNNATVSGTSAVAVGQGAAATAANSVALGANSVASEANTVSVGSVGAERRITNVAPGVNPTDAVNVGQLNSLRGDVNNVAKKAYTGVAAATALTMIPDVDLGKTFSLGVGVASYQGNGAVAIGGTARISENLKVKAGIGYSGQARTYGVGMGYQW